MASTAAAFIERFFVPFFGGVFLERGLETAMREVFEETGLRASGDRKLGDARYANAGGCQRCHTKPV